MWKIEFVFFLGFFSLMTSLFFNTSRILMFLMYLESFSLYLIFFLILNMSSVDYSLMLKMLVLMSCESAVGLSLLVLIVRKFSVDQLNLSSKFKLCEGF